MVSIYRKTETTQTISIMATKVGPSSSAHRQQSANHSLQYLGAKAAAALDKELMNTGAFSIDQLMELAGLSVSQAGKVILLQIIRPQSESLADQACPVYRVQPPSKGRRILVACGPGNNGALPLGQVGVCGHQG